MAKATGQETGADALDQASRERLAARIDAVRAHVLEIWPAQAVDLLAAMGLPDDAAGAEELSAEAGLLLGEMARRLRAWPDDAAPHEREPAFRLLGTDVGSHRQARELGAWRLLHCSLVECLWRTLLLEGASDRTSAPATQWRTTLMGVARAVLGLVGTDDTRGHEEL